jgi:hypothetical protein
MTNVKFDAAPRAKASGYMCGQPLASARGAVELQVMPDIILETMTDKCAHRICSCPARADTGYCSDYCVAASKDPDAGLVCGCGHPECKPGSIPMPTQSS